jgi:hypothetical protein
VAGRFHFDVRILVLVTEPDDPLSRIPFYYSAKVITWSGKGRVCNLGPMRSFDGDLSPLCSLRDASIHKSRNTDAALRSAIATKQSVDSHKPRTHSDEI